MGEVVTEALPCTTPLLKTTCAAIISVVIGSAYQGSGKPTRPSRAHFENPIKHSSDEGAVTTFMIESNLTIYSNTAETTKPWNCATTNLIVIK